MFDQKAYHREYQKKWAAKKRAQLDTLPKIPCGCGCGTQIPFQDAVGRPRKFAPHHARKRPAGKYEPPRVENAQAIICGCGCGETLLNRNAWGNKQFYIYGHTPNKRYPDAGAPIGIRGTSTNRKTLVSRERRWARKIAVLKHYSKSEIPVCACCGELEVAFLALDHTKGNGAAHRKELKGKSPYSWVVDEGFPEGFRILCHNCNMANGMYGFCPHQGRPA